MFALFFRDTYAFGLRQLAQCLTYDQSLQQVPCSFAALSLAAPSLPFRSQHYTIHNRGTSMPCSPLRRHWGAAAWRRGRRGSWHRGRHGSWRRWRRWRRGRRGPGRRLDGGRGLPKQRPLRPGRMRREHAEQAVGLVVGCLFVCVCVGACLSVCLVVCVCYCSWY